MSARYFISHNKKTAWIITEHETRSIYVTVEEKGTFSRSHISRRMPADLDFVQANAKEVTAETMTEWKDSFLSYAEDLLMTTQKYI